LALRHSIFRLFVDTLKCITIAQRVIEFVIASPRCAAIVFLLFVFFDALL
jgi:hypothetical protein